MDDEYMMSTWISEAGRKMFEAMQAPLRIDADVWKGAANWGISPLERIVILKSRQTGCSFSITPFMDYTIGKLTDTGIADWRPERDLYPLGIKPEIWEQVRGRAPLASLLVPRTTPTYGRTWVKTLKEAPTK